MRCPRCQTENREGAQFCRECGARLTEVCPNCGAQVNPGAKFCDNCGTALTATAVPSRFVSPETLTPAHLAERILTSRGALEGERKQVTVLFADMRGSTELIAGRDPEEARRLLDPVLELMIESVHHYEGTVNQVMGDGIMALFGAPLAHEDHAVRACYAALRMREAVSRYAEEIQRTQGVPISIRVGLNSGEVVVRSIGSDLHMDYTAVGMTTNLAARMEQIAMPGSILITPETTALAEGYVAVDPLGAMRVRGLDVPIEVFALTGAGPARTRLQVAALRGLSGFVGREAELDVLRQRLDKAAQSQGQVVALIGDPGVGKSRLVWEFTRSRHTRRWLILESTSASYGKATAYLPVLDLLKSYFQIEERDDVQRIREKVTGKLLTLDHALQPTLPAFFSLLDVPAEAAGWIALDPSSRRARTLDAVKRLLLRESQRQPLVVVFEDLHWIDAETQALLDALIESLPTARVLLLVNYRPEYRHDWGSRTYYTQLRIDPLPPESADELLNSLVGSDATLAPLKRLLIERTEGNPFFLEESVRTLHETRVLAGMPGAFTQVQPLARIMIPASVQAVLAARIDRLDPQDKHLLQSAAAIGKDVPIGLLEAVAGVDPAGLRRSLAALQAGEFLYEAAMFPDLEYTFKHSLTHEVTYAGLLQDRRRMLHTQILRAIETEYHDRLTEHVDRLAHHALQAEEWTNALTYYRQAAGRAAARGAYPEAAASFEHALAALAHLPLTAEHRTLAIDLRLDLRQVLFALGEFGRMLEHLREAETAAAALDDQQRLGRVNAYITQDFHPWRVTSLTFVMGAHDRAMSADREGNAAMGDTARRVMANLHRGEAHFWRGSYRAAAGALRENEALLGGDQVYTRFSRLGFAGLPSVFSRAFLVRALAELGEFDDAMQPANDAVAIAEQVREDVDLLAAHSAYGALLLCRGDHDRSADMLERCLHLEVVSGHPYWFPLIAAPLGIVYVRTGRLPEGLPLLEQAVELAERSRIRGAHSERLAMLSEAYLAADRVDEASALANRAVVTARRHGERGLEAAALRLLGKIAERRDPGDREGATMFYREARALAEELEMRPLAARIEDDLAAMARA